MSRCFPFPPPGYMRNGACSEDLMIKSIKLQKEMDETKEQRKEDKTKKKEKRKERKEKELNAARDETKEQRKKDKTKKKEKRKERKERKEKETNVAHHSDGKGKECKLKNVESFQLEKIRTEQGTGCLQKVGDEENEQIERSAITEEHDQPFSSTEPCCLSDSTQSSNKRKRSMSPSYSDHGTAFKIRLPLRKHTEYEELQQDYHAGSTESNGISRSVIEEPRHQVQGRRDSESEHNEHQYLIRSLTDPSTSTQTDPSTSTKSVDRKRGKMASLYNSLFQNWNSCALQLKGFELDDQEDWLSTSDRQEQTQATKKLKAVKDSLGCSSATPWPRAQYLREADIYALPYTVPF